MKNKILDLVGELGKSWRLFREHLNFCLGVGAIFLLVSFLLDMSIRLVTHGYGFDQDLFFEQLTFDMFMRAMPVLVLMVLIAFVVSAILKLGVIKVFLKLVDGGEKNFNDLWSTVGYLPSYIAAAIMMALVVGVGLVLLVVPGVYIYVRLQFFSILIIDKNLGPIKALKESWRLTTGRALDMFLLSVIIIAITLAGSLLVGVGLIVAVPVTMIFLAKVYRILSPVAVSIEEAV